MASKPIGKLKDQLVFLAWIIAVEKFIVSFEQQRIRKIVDIPQRVPVGSSAKAIVDSVIAAYQFHVTDERQRQIQPSQLVAGLQPPSLGPDISVILGSIPATDILTLDVKVRAQVQAGIERATGPGMPPSVIPLTPLARKAQFQVVVRLERHEPSHARAA